MRGVILRRLGRLMGTWDNQLCLSLMVVDRCCGYIKSDTARSVYRRLVA